MADPVLIQGKTELPVADIDASRRLRPVSQAGVDAILASIREVGQLATPIVVRQRRDRDGGLRYVLLDGAHRLAAAIELGWDRIPVRVFECTDDQARLLEIDGNLAGAELNALDTAVFLATRKAVYERLHPETKRGLAGATARWDDATDTMSVAFVKATADKFGLSERHVFRLLAAGSRLGADEVAQLRQAPRPVTLKDLQDLAKVNNAPDRYDVVAALAEGRAKSASAALKALKAPVEAPPKDPVEEQFLALMKVWARAGQRAKRRFVAECFDELGLLGADEEEARFEAEKPVLLAEVAAMRGRA